MKAVALVCLFFVSLSTLGQGSLETTMIKATCNCIHLILKPDHKESDTFTKCAMNNMGSDSILLKKECKAVYGDTTKKSCAKYGKDFF